MKQLYPFQVPTVERIVAAPLHRFGVGDETGLGKTGIAISACARVLAGRDSPRVLVCTPAIVRNHWAEEFDEWWPGHPGVGLITLGKARKAGVSKKAAAARDAAYSASIQVTSYGLVGEVDQQSWDAIILDEAHRLKNPASQQSRIVRVIVEANPLAMVVPMTATPMPDDICDIWNINDITWPGRFGTSSTPRYVSWSFAHRYSLWHEAIGTDGEVYGGSFKGINPKHAAELNERLQQCWSRTSKKAVAHLLPPFMVQLLKVDASKQLKFVNVDDWLARQGEEKLPFCKEWLDDAVETDSHVCILTHLTETVDKIGEYAARYGIPVHRVSGTHQPSAEQRNAVLAQAKAQPRAIIVATMHSVGIGIDLTFATKALFAELYWRPETVLQALGRFSRLSGVLPSSVTLLCLKGTVDEKMARTLLSKVSAISTAIAAGTGGESLLESLGTVHLTEREALDAINQVLFSTLLVEEY